mmetsp:Transcript_1823/g.3969  ORF Transcript_1823/g.3969 Transcript_1823/m.3969 type:complete len:200 (+) Transcript_1823:325-924(+)
MRSSLTRSSADDASSRIASRGLFNSSRPNASRCCSPSDKISDQSRSVSSPPIRSANDARSTVFSVISSRCPSSSCSSQPAAGGPIGVDGYISCCRSVPSVQYGLCGKKKVDSTGGRITVPVPDVHNPAMARSRELFPVPDGPTINNRSPSSSTRLKSFTSNRPLSSGVRSVRPLTFSPKCSVAFNSLVIFSTSPSCIKP